MSDESRKQAKVVGIIAAIVLAVLYFNGAFDKALAPVGLNWKSCGTNGFGATFCGDDLDHYKQRVVQPLQRASQEAEAAEWRAEEEAINLEAEAAEWEAEQATDQVLGEMRGER